MTVRTISDLKAAGNPVDGDLIEISHPNIDENSICRYASQKLTYKSLHDKIVVDSVISSAQKWHLSDDTDIDSMRQHLNQISSVMDVRESNGLSRAIFKEAPVSNGICKAQNDVPNRGQVIELVRDNSEFVAADSYVVSDPGNSSGHTNYGIPGLYTWHIDDGQKDSSKWINENEQEAGPVIVSETGNLVMYGWLASNSEVMAQEAWVGLYGRIYTAGKDSGNDNKGWVLLQVQPWIVGRNYQIAQYIGFNVPVRAGLQLKVMTGFKVSGQASGLHIGNTLMFNGEGNMPNTFAGYVIQN